MKERRKNLLALSVATMIVVTGVPVSAQEITTEPTETLQQESGAEQEETVDVESGDSDIIEVQDEEENEKPNLLTEIKEKDGKDLSNITTPDHFTAELTLENVKKSSVHQVTLVYERDEEEYTYQSEYDNQFDPDDNGKVTCEVEVDLDQYEVTGEYNLKEIDISFVNDDRVEYEYDSEENEWLIRTYDAEENTWGILTVSPYSYNGKVDFVIGTSEKEDEVPNMLIGVSARNAKDANNKSLPNQFVLEVKLKNVDDEGIRTVRIDYDYNGKNYHFDEIYSTPVKPDSNGEVTCEAKINFNKTVKYKKYTLQRIEIDAKNYSSNTYKYDAEKKALSAEAGHGKYHDFQYNGEADLVQGLDEVTDLKASSYGKNKVLVQWEESTKVDGYLIYGKSASGKYGYIGMTTKNTYFLHKTASDTEYNFYWVYPYVTDTDGKRIVGKSPDYVYAKGVCASVTNLKAANQKGAVKLTWTKSADAQGYLIYGKTASGEYGYIGMTTSTSYVDKKASKSEYNFYWVYPYYKDADGKKIVGQKNTKYVYGKAK